MPRAEILSKQALHTITQLHAELAGKIETNSKSGDKLRSQMVQVEAVMKMLDPEFNAWAISAKRRNRGNPWFRRGTLCRAVVDTLRRAERPMTADDNLPRRCRPERRQRPPGSRKTTFKWR
jgi:hypothetical protein